MTQPKIIAKIEQRRRTTRTTRTIVHDLSTWEAGGKKIGKKKILPQRVTWNEFFPSAPENKVQFIPTHPKSYSTSITRPTLATSAIPPTLSLRYFEVKLSLESQLHLIPTTAFYLTLRVADRYLHATSSISRQYWSGRQFFSHRKQHIL